MKTEGGRLFTPRGKAAAKEERPNLRGREVRGMGPYIKPGREKKKESGGIEEKRGEESTGALKRATLLALTYGQVRREGGGASHVVWTKET